MSRPIIRIEKVSKSYGGVRALTNVSFSIETGTIHALCGENGAGKSTLIKILGGAIKPDWGEIFLDDQPLVTGSVLAAERSGIGVIHQEAVVFPHLNTYDNIFLGSEPRWFGGCLLDQRAMRTRVHDLFARLGESFPFDRPVGQLSVALRQMVAIARAISRKSRLLIMDEPTASLSARETSSLLRLVRQLQSEGVSILYVSHRLEEIFELASKVTILRDGELVETCDTASIDSNGLIARMVGRAGVGTNRRPSTQGNVRAGKPLLEVQQISRAPMVREISFELAAGEIVGLAGLVGAGRTELTRILFGLDRPDRGTIRVAGETLQTGSVRAAMRAGVALVPEDRQREGLVLPMGLSANLSMPQWKRLTKWGLLSARREQDLVAESTRRLRIKAAGPRAAAATLSGGNQQKLVLGKWLATRPRVLILDEPTRGVDVGAKDEIYRLIESLAASGMAILLVSSEMTEILQLSQRILVMRQGTLTGELSSGEATEQRILSLALVDPPPADGVAAR
jgi:rhamnose transport system ATP-binding protein